VVAGYVIVPEHIYLLLGEPEKGTEGCDGPPLQKAQGWATLGSF
jgi:hypothetical protein